MRSKNKPLILAHRGLRERHGDNTLDAFRAAIAAGADGFETDIQLTADFELVAHHDSYAPAAGSYFPVVELPAQALGDDVPRLAEILREFRDAFLNIELKPPATGDRAARQSLVTLVCAALIEHPPRSSVLISSFDGDLLRMFASWWRRLHDARPPMTGLLHRPGADPKKAVLRTRQVGAEICLLHLSSLEEGGHLGAPMGVWGITDPANQLARQPELLRNASLLITDRTEDALSLARRS
jgi:hypothetical protein